MKTSELTGAALDWAVAKCEGIEVRIVDGLLVFPMDLHFSPSCEWAQGGPLIEKYGITIADHSPGHRFKIKGWVAWRGNRDPDMGWNNQPTPLIAAMQCIVATELGVDIDVPEELK